MSQPISVQDRQYGLVIYGLSSIHDAKINNNIGLLKTQQYYLILFYHHIKW